MNLRNAGAAPQIPARFLPLVPANIYSLAYTAMGRSPLEQDFRLLNSADLVVFQDRRVLYPPFTNQRVGDYERYVQRVGLGPIKITDDTSVYLLRRHQSD